MSVFVLKLIAIGTMFIITAVLRMMMTSVSTSSPSSITRRSTASSSAGRISLARRPMISSASRSSRR